MSSITYEVTVSEHYTKWELDGKFHRVGGPAIEYATGTKEWCINGELHREGGPAIEFSDGDKYWYLNGKRHRENGPAVECANGSKKWYLNGKRMTEEEHRIRTQPAVEMTVAEIEQLLGKRVKITK
jgi:hypothetical protein